MILKLKSHTAARVPIYLSQEVELQSHFAGNNSISNLQQKYNQVDYVAK